LAHLHGRYGHGIPRVPTDKPTGKPLSILRNNQPMTGAAKVGGDGDGNGDSNISGYNGNNGVSGGGKDNGGNSAAVAAAAAVATKTKAVTAMVGDTDHNRLKRRWKKRRWRQGQRWGQRRWRRQLWWKRQQQQ
jgi:hypothetical protein